MIAIITLLLLSAASVLDASPVVYGKDVPIVRYPFLVYLEISDSKGDKDEDGNEMVDACGGTLIGLRTILTAAHCLDTKGKATIEASAGFVHLSDKTRQRRKATLYKKHEQYQPMVEASQGVKAQQIENDLAIIWVTKPFNENDKVKVASLPTSDPVLATGFTGATLMFMGWGSSETGRDEDQLKEGPSTAISLDDCEKKHKIDKDENFICVEKPTEATLCFGDSGGPLVYNNTPIGVASFIVAHVKTTATPKPGVKPPTTTTTTTESPAEFSCRSQEISTFMNIFRYVSWINTNVDPPKVKTG